jgi:hypothetical protein
VAPQKQDVPIMYNTCSTHGDVSDILLHGRRHDVIADLATLVTQFLLRLLLLILCLLQMMMMMNDIFLNCNCVAPGASITVHIYTQIQRTTQNQQYIEQHDTK